MPVKAKTRTLWTHTLILLSVIFLLCTLSISGQYRASEQSGYATIESDPATVQDAQLLTATQSAHIKEARVGLIISVTVSQDHQFIGIGGNLGFEVVDAQTFTEIWFNEISSTVTALAFSSHGKFLVSLQRNEQVLLWDAKTGRQISPLADAWAADYPCAKGIKILDCTALWTPYRLGSIDLSEQRDKRQAKYNELADDTSCIKNGGNAYSPDGKLLVQICIYYKAPYDELSIVTYFSLWNLENGQEIAKVQIAGLRLPVNPFSPDNKFLGVRTARGVSVLDISTGTIVSTLPSSSYPILNWLSPDRLLVSGEYDKNMLVMWKIANGSFIHELLTPTNWRRTIGSKEAVENDWSESEGDDWQYPGFWSPDNRFYVPYGGVPPIPQAIIDRQSGRVIDLIDCGHGIRLHGWSADSRYAWLSSHGTYGFNDLTVFDTVRWQVAFHGGGCYGPSDPVPPTAEILATLGAGPEILPTPSGSYGPNSPLPANP